MTEADHGSDSDEEEITLEEESFEEGADETPEDEADELIDYESFTVDQLKDLLKKVSKPVSGKKAELIERLKIAKLEMTLTQYKTSFSKKEMILSVGDVDILMSVFQISPELKGMNKQYWGRELGKCWEKLVVGVFRGKKGFGEAIQHGADEPCDLAFNKYAIDTKYRVGSGDSGTLKKFKQYGKYLKDEGYTPVMLFLREDNLPAAITAMRKGGWLIITGDDSFKFIQKYAQFDLKGFLISKKGQFSIL